MNRSISKSDAWDRIGSQFWNKGRESAKPSEKELAIFCSGIEKGQRCAIIGASTKGLVAAVSEITPNVIVFDFSARMCAELSQILPDIEVHLVDITQPLPDDLVGTFDWVLSERLINRFDGDEAVRGVASMNALLRGGGVLRTSVWLGLYPMDRAMIEYGCANGTVDQFWDEATTTINFSQAGKALTEKLMPHGSIAQKDLHDWYLGRGREKRFSDEEIRELILSTGFHSLTSLALPDATNSSLYTATKDI